MPLNSFQVISGTLPPPFQMDNKKLKGLNTKDWFKILRQFPKAFTKGTTMTLHKENDYAYQKVGKCIDMGKIHHPQIPCHDHCFQFETQWERMKENEIDALTFIWHEHLYHQDRGLTCQ